MTDTPAWIRDRELLLLAAFAAGIVLLDALAPLADHHLPILAAIVIPLYEGLRRRFVAEEHGC